MRNHILYLAHSNLGYINECRFSLLKFLSIYNLKPPVHTAMVIYTDKPQLFEMFIPFFPSFTIEQILPEQIKEWQGSINYIHRAKPMVIKSFFKHFEGAVLFMDTDTYITAPIDAIWEKIEGGQVVMHQSEGVIDSSKNAEFKKWDLFLKNNSIQFGGQTFQYNPDFQVWNSGVLGISKNELPVIDDVIQLIDAIHAKFPKHITEQVACSYLLQQKATIYPANSNVVHYWDLKEFRKFLNVFFKKNEEESIPNLVKAVHGIDAAEMQQQKNNFEALPLYKKWMLQLQGRHWHIDKHIKKL